METTEALKAPELYNNLTEEKEEWTEVIEPRTSLLDLRLGDVCRYRDLVMMFVRRDFISTYKQTILGPIWFIIQPILTTIVGIIIFGWVTQINTYGLPMIAIYLAGITIRHYFPITLISTSAIFTNNAKNFDKVYFLANDKYSLL